MKDRKAVILMCLKRSSSIFPELLFVSNIVNFSLNLMGRHPKRFSWYPTKINIITRWSMSDFPIFIFRFLFVYDFYFSIFSSRFTGILFIFFPVFWIPRIHIFSTNPLPLPPKGRGLADHSEAKQISSKSKNANWMVVQRGELELSEVRQFCDNKILCSNFPISYCTRVIRRKLSNLPVFRS